MRRLRAEAVRGVEFLGDVPVTPRRALMFKQRTARFGKRVRAPGVITDAVRDVAGILLLAAVLPRVTFHGQQSRYGADRNLDAVSTAIRSLHRKVGNNRRAVLHDVDLPRHQEVGHPINGRAAVRCRDRADELEAPKTCPLCLSMIHQGLDKGWSGPLWVDSSELIE